MMKNLLNLEVELVEKPDWEVWVVVECVVVEEFVVVEMIDDVRDDSGCEGVVPEDVGYDGVEVL